VSRDSRHAVRVERRSALRGADIWLAVPEHRPIVGGEVQDWLATAEEAFGASPELASIVVDAPGAPPVRIFNGLTAELIGLPAEPPPQPLPYTVVEQWLAAARLKGLVQANWAELQPLAPTAIRLGIDAAWLLGGESGAQVYVFELIAALARRPEIARIVLLSDAGGVPTSLSGMAKVEGMTWREASAGPAPMLDIMHRPYQPGVDVDYGRYYRVAPCVAVTVLDFIAYDNRSYHVSDLAWRDYQHAFDDQVCRADAVFAISQHVGSRVVSQLPHQLSGPVLVVPPGTDHLRDRQAPDAPSLPELQALEGRPFLLALGNDFEHKNRDFAVKVFTDLCERGYGGTLVLAGFHVDAGSSFDHELNGTGQHHHRIIRLGPLDPADKLWVLSRAGVVLYPTSVEGFGLVPFEAAAMGRPAAFVRFGVLRETLPEVDACRGWQVSAFADHVRNLLAAPDTNVSQIRAAGAGLTWERTAGLTLAGYQALLSPASPWRTRARSTQPPAQSPIGSWRRSVERLASAIGRRIQP